MINNRFSLYQRSTWLKCLRRLNRLDQEGSEGIEGNEGNEGPCERGAVQAWSSQSSMSSSVTSIFLLIGIATKVFKLAALRLDLAEFVPEDGDFFALENLRVIFKNIVIFVMW